MSEGGASKDIFDVERIRQIIELMEAHDLTEVDLQQGEEKIKLGRGGMAAAPMIPAAPMPAAPAGLPADAAASAAPSNTVTIDSPMVGTFYSKPNPEAKSFVSVGDTVGPDTIVCIIEAMKVFNEIPAECSGKVVEILASEADAVDFGKPLIRIEPS
ncbi:MAG: acetyl-CoA carboxylase biotin carboxyl carrier protein [Planctomycetota bacterium]